MRPLSELLRRMRPVSGFAKFSAGVISVYLLLRVIGLFLKPPQFLMSAANLALFVVVVRYLFKLMRWTSRRLLWRLRRRLVVTYLLVGVVPVILLFFIMVIVVYVFFSQLSSYYELTEINHLMAKLETANRAISGTLLESLASNGSDTTSWSKQLSPLLSDLGTNFSRVLIDVESGTRHAALELEGGKLAERRDGAVKPFWLTGSAVGLFEDQSRVYFTSLVTGGNAQSQGYVLLRAPLDSVLLKRFSERFQISISIMTLVPASEDPGNNSFKFSFGDKIYAQREIHQVDPGVASEYTRRQAWYDFGTHFLFFPPNVRVWNTGNPLKSILWMHLLDSTWMRLARPFFTRDFAEGENIILVLLVGASVFFLIIEFMALLSSLVMTRTITGAVHNLDQGAKHIMRGDFSHRIRVKSRDQLSSLGETFNSMTASIERLLKEQVEKQRLESELAIALEVQKQLFPRESPRLQTLEVVGACHPARIVSGDYYDYILIPPASVGLALGDVSGKGVSAALLMASLQAALRSHSSILGNRSLALASSGAVPSSKDVAMPLVSDSVADIVSSLSQQLYQNSPSEKYVTFFYGIYDEWRRQLTYTNAGHLPPLVFSREGVRRLETGGTVLGLINESKYQQGEVKFSPKDVFIAYTDGISEAENSFEEQFGESRLIQVVEKSIEKPPDEILDGILEAVRDWVGSGEPQDDMTLIVAKAL
ncbi:MAG: SpoIIE family protein phosphatase [Acidobacteriia bacterium]|nr:SpoIIE family protein phosphatase [Terriglobia bacterium]